MISGLESVVIRARYINTAVPRSFSTGGPIR